MMRHNNSKNAFTMVEMLAVVSVMAVIVAITIPNGIFARTAGEESQVRASAAAIESAMQSFKLRGGYNAAQEWSQRHAVNPAAIHMLPPLQNDLGRLSTAEFINTFAGYDLEFPQILGGPLVVRRSSDGAVVYP